LPPFFIFAIMNFSQTGLYIHIPFCKSKCPYCDFYSTVKLNYIDAYIEALLKEIELKKNLLPTNQLTSIYFGGGTPSLLNEVHLSKIFEAINQFFSLAKNCEITIEVNPENVSNANAQMWKATGFNRISIGTQSFDDETLKFLGRKHSAAKNIEAINILTSGGFTDISADIIYGIPGQPQLTIQHSLTTLIDNKVKHISAYHLSIEPNTVFGILHKKNKLATLPEEESFTQYLFVCNFLKSKGYNHYEISNFSKKNFESRHNSGYWFGMKYIGIGASAHSYTGEKRMWNVANIYKYINSINNGRTDFFEEETLSIKDKFNDYVITSLRTSNGLSLSYVKDFFGIHYYNHILKTLEKYKDLKDLMIFETNRIILTDKGMFVSDGIMEDFII
jgi:oxygen-independent coproporphyrinogen-3 oxidase